MARLTSSISVSLDGYVAGPSPSLDDPLGIGGEQLHEWVFPTKAWREPHGESGGETGPDSDVVAESLENVGATVMGRKMFSGGEGPWEDDPNADAWWGEEPPFRHPVFVLTHHPRETVAKQGGTTFTFVTDGIESALAQATEAADGKDVAVAGGAAVIQQYLSAGLLDELEIHLVPVLLGGGTPLLDNLGGGVRLEQRRVIGSTAVAHLKYRVAK